ncbi:PQ-loop domain-containing transporter [[Mycoplasma] mobile]|uniref:Expressed protein n=1 Tax=Mycoplasma mobile (strain ATCC 43663 / 163K / NCTC 11711) TaxID=267748 RepID=Q6KH19_MYCM1|nr:PQ-loop domain-containing transporter [[Mycoplasma] mobile]AAT28112.1 expressed protein [Mycoplasma mobile 163K]
MDQELLILGLIISTIAGIFSAIAFIPQTIKSIVSKSTFGLSIGLISFGIIASSIWIIWGILSSIYIPSINATNNVLPSSLGPGFEAAQTAAPIWTNTLVLIWSLALLISKLQNTSKAKKLNLTEEEYSNKKILEVYKKNKAKKSLISKMVLKMIKSSIPKEESKNNV